MAGSSDIPLLGRSAELGRVLDALHRAADGAGGTLLLAGEPGIGKTRLATEALTLARRRGFLTLECAAYPLQADLAYAPVLEAFGPYLGGLAAGRVAELVRGLPDLGRLFAGLHLPPPEPLGDAAIERTRLFEAVSRLVERVATEGPLVLLVDDLHWVDASSMELLHYVARSLGTRRVLLIGAYRLDEARTHPGLRTMVRSLQRLGLAEELLVDGLGPEPVAALARALLGGEPPAELLVALHDRAAGTPLFVTALLRGLRDTGALFRSGGAWTLGDGSTTAVPRVMRDLVLARLERLGPAERALLELIVVAGDVACPAVLGRVGGQQSDELDAALRRLGESGFSSRSPDRPTSPTAPRIPWWPRSPTPSCQPCGDAGCTRGSRRQWSRSARRMCSGSPTTTGARPARPIRDAPSTSWSPRADGPRRCTPMPRLPNISRPPWRSPVSIDRPWSGSCSSVSGTHARGRAGSMRRWPPGPRPPAGGNGPATVLPPPACAVCSRWPSGTGDGSTRPRRNSPPDWPPSREPGRTRR
ncbi:MAG TPA: AAA family ATPase [Nakamurella sp.]